MMRYGLILVFTVMLMGFTHQDENPASLAVAPEQKGVLAMEEESSQSAIRFAKLVNNWQVKVDAAEPTLKWFYVDPSGRERVDWEEPKKELNIPTCIIVVGYTGEVHFPTDPAKLSDEYVLKLLSDQQKPIYTSRFGMEGAIPDVRGHEVQSGHFSPWGWEWYIVQHDFIMPDGRIIPGLARGQVAWGAGNWTINLLGEVQGLVGSYETERPSEATLEALAEAIRQRVNTFRLAGLSDDHIWVIGHRTAREKTKVVQAPGSWWYENNCAGRRQVLELAGLKSWSDEPIGWSKVTF